MQQACALTLRICGIIVPFEIRLNEPVHKILVFSFFFLKKVKIKKGPSDVLLF